MRKGPEINLSKLRSGGFKPPPGLAGVYRELKSQHLLLIVVLLVVALVAVPLLIKSKGAGDEAGSSTVPTIASGSSAEQSLQVSRWTPAILDYKKSLDGGHPTNPFVTSGADEAATTETSPGGEEAEPNTETSSGGEEAGSGGGSESAALEASGVESEGGSTSEATTGGGPSPTESTSSPEQRPEGSGGEDEGDGSGKKGEKDRKKEEDEESITADFQVTEIHEDGGVDRSPIHRDVQKLTKLPNQSHPALIYVGPSGDGAKALMQVSPEVTAMIGDSNCVVHGDPCGVLALEVAKPETIVYGPRALTYRIELVRIGEHGLTSARRKSGLHHPKSVDGSGDGPVARYLEGPTGISGNWAAEVPLLSFR